MGVGEGGGMGCGRRVRERKKETNFGSKQAGDQDRLIKTAAIKDVI